MILKSYTYSAIIPMQGSPEEFRDAVNAEIQRMTDEFFKEKETGIFTLVGGLTFSHSVSIIDLFDSANIILNFISN